MKTVFRADASLQIGTGHVMRCLTLADELVRQGGECWFVCREHPGHLGDVIVDKGHHLILLPGRSHVESEHSTEWDSYADWLGVPWREDARQTRTAVRPLAADWLVVDHYALDARWEQAVADEVAHIMVIDDLADRPHDCMVLLDQNLGRLISDYDGLVPGGCQRLIGPGYALLRPEFAALRDESLLRRKPPRLERILISLGGIDQLNVTGEILSGLSKLLASANIELDIIMGATAPFLKEVRHQAAQLPFPATVSVNVQDMAQRMCAADLCLGAVGSTSWERCCLGLPSILIIVADNQKSAAVALQAKRAAVIVVNTWEACEEVARLIASDNHTEDLARMVKVSSEIVQGDGCPKVVRELFGRRTLI